MNIAFFHGLESPSVSDKSEWLNSTYKNVYTPAMDYRDPGLFNRVLKEVKDRKIDLLVGSSMGGWFAYCISTLTGIPTVLFNPAFHSRSFDPSVSEGGRGARHIVVLGKKDDLIDPATTQEWIKNNGKGKFTVHMEGNGHRTPIGIFTKYLSGMKESQSTSKHVKLFEEWLFEKKPKGAPEWKDSDAPDAEGRFRDLGIKDLAAWLIKTRKGDLKKISGSLTQQVVFNRNDDPEYAKKMEKVRQEVYKQLGREDLMEKESPYDEETLKKYQKEYEEGKDIPFGVRTSLIAQGMIPREGGPDKGKKVKSEEYK